MTTEAKKPTRSKPAAKSEVAVRKFSLAAGVVLDELLMQPGSLRYQILERLTTKKTITEAEMDTLLKVPAKGAIRYLLAIGRIVEV